MARIRTRQMAQLFRRVGLSLRAGVDVVRIWTSESQRGAAAQREAMETVRFHVASGDSVADSLQRTNGYFPSLACEMVDVGEHAGRLDETFLRLADYYDHLLELRRTFLIGIIWPMLQLVAAILVVGGVIWLVGVLTPMTGGEPVDILGLGLTGTRGALIYFSIVGLIVGGMTAFVMAVRRGLFGTAPILLAMKIPVLGKCLQTMALERLTWALAMSLESGMDAKRSIQLALRATQNPVYLAQQERVHAAIVQGREFHEALRSTHVFPDDFLNALESAEISGTQTDSLERLSKEYQEQAQTMARALTVASTFIIWGLVAMLIIFFIIRFAMFYLGTIYGALNDL